jgi:hypothetical protein
MEYPHAEPTPERVLGLIAATGGASHLSGVSFYAHPDEEAAHDAWARFVDALDSLGWLTAESVNTYDADATLGSPTWESVHVGGVHLYGALGTTPATAKLHGKSAGEPTPTERLASVSLDREDEATVLVALHLLANESADPEPARRALERRGVDADSVERLS